MGHVIINTSNDAPVTASNPLPITGGGGTQYTEADTDTTITGTAVMWEDASDTLRAVSAAKPLPVTVASITAGNTNIGDVDVASIAAGDNNIGNVDVVTLPALPTGTNAIGATKDNGPNWTSVFGVAGARFTSADQSASAASVTDAPTAGQKLVITDILVSTGSAIRVDFKEETSGTVLASLYMGVNDTQVWVPRGKLKLATADKKLQVQTSLIGAIAVTVGYYSET